MPVRSSSLESVHGVDHHRRNAPSCSNPACRAPPISSRPIELTVVDPLLARKARPCAPRRVVQCLPQAKGDQCRLQVRLSGSTGFFKKLTALRSAHSLVAKVTCGVPPIVRKTLFGQSFLGRSPTGTASRCRRSTSAWAPWGRAGRRAVAAWGRTAVWVLASSR
jgi:hypothetical protein